MELGEKSVALILWLCFQYLGHLVICRRISIRKSKAILVEYLCLTPILKVLDSNPTSN